MLGRSQNLASVYVMLVRVQWQQIKLPWYVKDVQQVLKSNFSLVCKQRDAAHQFQKRSADARVQENPISGWTYSLALYISCKEGFEQKAFNMNKCKLPIACTCRYYEVSNYSWKSIETLLWPHTTCVTTVYTTSNDG